MEAQRSQLSKNKNFWDYTTKQDGCRELDELCISYILSLRTRILADCEQM